MPLGGRSIGPDKWSACHVYFIGALLACLAAQRSPVCAQSSGDEYKRNIESAVLEFEAGNWAEARELPSGQVSDSCCPPGISEYLDKDCPPKCGNGAIESGEECDGAFSDCENCMLALAPPETD